MTTTATAAASFNHAGSLQPSITTAAPRKGRGGLFFETSGVCNVVPEVRAAKFLGGNSEVIGVSLAVRVDVLCFNNRMLWLIENIVKEASAVELAEAVKRAGLPCQEILGDFAVADIEHLKAKPSPVLFCGSIEMTKLIREQLHATCAPICYASAERFLCTIYYPVFREFLFNDRYTVLPLAELTRQRESILNTFGREGMVFVRPGSGDKPFKAGLVDRDDIDGFCDQFAHLRDELIIVSTPKNITGEWRFIVGKSREIIAFSSYRLGGKTIRESSAPQNCVDFCRKILSVGYFPDSVFAIDIAHDNDGEPWLMELTSFSSAGLYACDKDAIVRSVTEIALRDFDEWTKGAADHCCRPREQATPTAGKAPD